MLATTRGSARLLFDGRAAPRRPDPAGSRPGPRPHRAPTRYALTCPLSQAAATALPNAASADGAVSAATVARSRGIYGGRIAELKDAVAKGDFEAVLAEKNAFDLFNSGAYAQKSAITKAQKAIAVTETKNIMEAIATKNPNQLKTAYAAYMKNANIDASAVNSIMDGQGYSTEYDWKVRTKKGTIYQR